MKKVRSFNDIRQHPLVASVSDERDSGSDCSIWVYLKRGWKSSEGDGHAVVETTVSELVRSFNDSVVPCGCAECAGGAR